MLLSLLTYVTIRLQTNSFVRIKKEMIKCYEINSMRKEESAKRQKKIYALRSILIAAYDLKIQQSDKKEEQLEK